jgi:hypothetical protein
MRLFASALQDEFTEAFERQMAAFGRAAEPSTTNGHRLACVADPGLASVRASNTGVGVRLRPDSGRRRHLACRPALRSRSS